MKKESPGFTWKFHRIGGLDQVMLRTADELRNLRQLDPKLWVALSCPSSGLEINHRTLELIDTDNDGRIRVPEILAAVEWLCARLQNPEDMIDAPESLPLDQIHQGTEEGAALLKSAKAVLAAIGKPDATEITPEDVAGALAIAGQQDFNGDGILPPLPVFDHEINQFIQDALDEIGGMLDSSGKPGINKEIAEAFIATLRSRQAWKETVGNALTPLAHDTEEAWNLILSLKDKIDDYFLRCDLAAFAPSVSFAVKEAADRAATLQQLEQGGQIIPEDLVAHPGCIQHGLLASDALADLPLARIEPSRPLCLSTGLNPAWRTKVERFAELMAPLLATPGTLTRDDWKKVQETFTEYQAALTDKPGPANVDIIIPPVQSLDQLSNERIDAILNGDILDRFLELVAKDAEAPSATTDIADLERMVLYHCYLHQLLMNFVSFYDFYSLHRKATFQSGTLLMDGRACVLCLPVTTDVAKHAALAGYSHLCLLYCECHRKDADGNAQTKNIVAAMTVGDADMLNEGRNGVFVDDNGDDWDATLTKMVSNPISIRQAMWDPYKRFGKMITEQISKFAANKQAQATQKLQDIASKSTAAATGGLPAVGGFDIGKSVGVFAAIGLALGALGTAVAAIAKALLSLAWWQFPLLLLGGFLLISGPSMILAALKLRKRTLGPLLEASGWAVNGRVPINFFLGWELTSEAQLPSNATRSYNDPLYKKPTRWPYITASILVALLILVGGWIWADNNKDSLPKWLKDVVVAAEQAPQKIVEQAK